MTKLSAFKIDSKALENGEWVQPGEEYGTLEILTRGFTDAYVDAKAARMRKVALGFAGDVNKIPNAIGRAITTECLIAHVLLDVRGIEGDDGQPIGFAAFCDLLRDPDYSDLLNAVVAAAAQSGKRNKALLALDAGN